MNNSSIYIIGGNDLKFPIEISSDSRVVFLDKEDKSYANRVSLIAKLQENQTFLREKWLDFQTKVFLNLKPYINKDEDYRYLLCNIFFEASPNKTNVVYLFFKLYLIIDQIKKEKIQNVYLVNVNKIISDFFNSNKQNFSFQIKKTYIRESETFSLNILKNILKKKKVPSLIFSLLKEYKKKQQKIIPKRKFSRKIVLSYYYPGGYTSNQKFSSKYFQDVSSLINDNYEWLFLYQGNISKINEENKKIEANRETYGFLDAYFSYSDFKYVTKKFLKLRKKLGSLSLNNLFLFEGINYLSLTKNEWYKSISISLIDLLIFEKKISNFFSLNPEINELIYLLEFQPWEQILNKAAKKKQIKTKGVIHSIVRPNVMNFYHSKEINLYLYTPSLIGVNSDFAKSLLLQNGFDRKKLFEIEAHRFNYLKSINFQDKNKKPKTEKTILIITSVIMSETRELLELFALSDVKFDKVFIKEHPLFPVSSIIESSIKNFPPYEIFKDSVQEAFNHSDIVYTANGSSVLLEAVVNNKQTISVISLSSLPIPAIDKASNLHFVYDVKSLSKILKRLTIETFDLTSENGNIDYLYLNSKLSLWQDFLNK